jgi:Flp pilus assembly pilin Flp
MFRPFDRYVLRLRIANDTRGQDLIEYALVAGLVATVSFVVFGDVQESLQHILSGVVRVLRS